MDSTNRHKSKNKNSATPKRKTHKKRKTNDGPTCSMFLAELTRKLSHRKKMEEEMAVADSQKNVINTIIESLSSVIVTFSKKSLVPRDSLTKMETLHSLAPELIPNDSVEIKAQPETVPLRGQIRDITLMSKIPKMPIPMDAFEKPTPPILTKIPVETLDSAVNTGGDFDVAEEISKHVGTLRKISLIAEEFNQKTAKNLKEIVDSVQEDLIKKLEEIQAAAAAAERKSKEEAAIGNLSASVVPLQK